MKTQWDTITEWMEKNNADALSTFNEGATLKQLNQLEVLIGKPMPDSFKEFYRVHNGQDTSLAYNSAIVEPESEGLLAIENIIEEWNKFEGLNNDFANRVTSVNAKRGIRPVFWNKYWVPVMDDGDGNSFCIDLDPAEGGTSGQIIFRNHEGPTYHIVAKSFEAWVDQFIDFYLY